MSRISEKTNNEKTIIRTKIFHINAERQVLCAPPSIWIMEAAIDVTYSDGSSEVQYITDCDFEDCCLQIMSKSPMSIGMDEHVEPYIIAVFENEEDALATPYADSIRLARSIFAQLVKS